MSGKEGDTIVQKPLDSLPVLSRDYKALLNGSKKRINKIMDTGYVQELIPLSEKEYLDFYNLSNDELSNKLFLELDSIFYRYSINEGVLVKYLNMAGFVDGEYAESYFDGVDYLIYDKKRSFCKVVFKLSKEALVRLNEYKELCQ